MAWVGENEETFMDENGQVVDDYRIQFISQHLYWLLKAVEEGRIARGICSGLLPTVSHR